MKKDNKKLYIFFVILSLLFGITFSILIPMYQVPDEETHLNYIYSYLEGNSDFAIETNNYGNTMRIIKNQDEKVDLNQYLDFSKKLDVLKKIKTFDIHIIGYLPQTIGLLISELFHFPIIISLTFSEILAVLFYTFICLIALKLMPIKKEIFMAIMLLPIAVQQMGSFSYDVILNSMSFLFIAYLFKLKYDNSKVTIKNIIILFFIIGIIGLVKIPYILLILLLFTIPLKKYWCYDSINSWLKKNKILFIILLIIFILTSLIIAYKLILNINYAKVIIAYIINPLSGAKLIIKTIYNYYKHYISSIVGNFGWFDTSVESSIPTAIFIFISFIIMLILSDTDNKIKRKEKLFLLLYSLSFCIIIIISMFDWTLFYLGIDTSRYSVSDYAYQINNIKDILGVQGRYFLPILPIILIPLNINLKIKNKERKLFLFQTIYYSVIYVNMAFIILNRYWIH